MKARRRFDFDDHRFEDRNPLVMAAVAGLLVMALVTVALNLTRLPLINNSVDHAAYLQNASGLTGSETVQVRGVRVGRLTGISIEGNVVRVDFEVDADIALGSRTSAAVKVLNPLGSQFLELEPQGPGQLSEPIPSSRTYVSRSLLGELGKVSDQIGDIDVPQLQRALNTANGSLSKTSAKAVRRSLVGLNRFAGALAADADGISALLNEGSELTEIINNRRTDLVRLVSQGDALVRVLNERKAAMRALLRGTSSLADQVAKLLEVNQEELTPMLINLRQIADVLAKENKNLARAIPALAELSGNLARVSGSGRFIDLVVPTGIIPDALIAPCSSPQAFPKPSDPAVGCRP